MWWRIILVTNAVFLATTLALVYFNPIPYRGPQVAAFTTGNAPCSPICGPKQ